MNTKRPLTLLSRWPLITAGLIALFWGIWYFIAGSVPTVQSIKMLGGWTLELPFPISRWWDIALGPLLSFLFILLILIAKSKMVQMNEEEKNDLIGGLIGGPVIGRASGRADAVIGLSFGMAFGLVYGLVFGLIGGMVIGMTSGLIFGLIGGMVIGLVFWLIGGMVIGLVIMLVWGIKKLFSLLLWQSIKNWLMAR